MAAKAPKGLFGPLVEALKKKWVVGHEHIRHIPNPESRKIAPGSRFPTKHIPSGLERGEFDITYYARERVKPTAEEAANYTGMLSADGRMITTAEAPEAVPCHVPKPSWHNEKDVKALMDSHALHGYVTLGKYPVMPEGTTYLVDRPYEPGMYTENLHATVDDLTPEEEDEINKAWEHN